MGTMLWFALLLSATSALHLPTRPTTYDATKIAAETEESAGELRCEASGPPPTKCGPNNRWSLAELNATLAEFGEVWKRHPAGGKLGPNHMFNEWFLAKTLKPSAIIESGVLHGQATFHLRAGAGPDTPIFCLDPKDNVNLAGKSKYVFKDKNPNTKYFLGKDWIDLPAMDWDKLIPHKDRANTLVILDDHQMFHHRFKQLVELGFRHIFMEDNYGYPQGDCVSPNAFCTELPADVTEVIYKQPYGKAELGSTKAGNRRPESHWTETVPRAEHEKTAEYIRSHIKTYFEFPAIWDKCEARTSIVQKEDIALLTRLGLPPQNSQQNKYANSYPWTTLFAPYIELQ